MQTPKPRLILGDDHELVLEGIRALLTPNFDIVGQASNGRDLVAMTQKLTPDAVVLDISMPGLNGVEAARQIKAANSSAKIVFVSQMVDRAYLQAAFEAGASAYVSKQCVVHELMNGIHEALRGRYYVSNELRVMLSRPMNDGANPSDLFGGDLTERQREVLQLIAEGKSNKEIAGVLDISVKTVEFHKSRLMDQLGLRTTAELTRYAMEHGIVAPVCKTAAAN